MSLFESTLLSFAFAVLANPSYICIHVYICNTAALINMCRFFFLNVVKFMQTRTKLDLPTLRKGSTEERTQRNK